MFILLSFRLLCPRFKPWIDLRSVVLLSFDAFLEILPDESTSRPWLSIKTRPGHPYFKKSGLFVTPCQSLEF
jgi:hypothetical protein